MPFPSVLIMLVSVVGPDLMFTTPVVLSVPVAELAEVDGAVAAPLPPLPPLVKKSDLIKPLVPLTLTLDQPAGLCSITSTLVPATTVLNMLESVDADDLRFTPLVVRKVAGVLPIGNLRKSDLIYPVEPPT